MRSTHYTHLSVELSSQTPFMTFWVVGGTWNHHLQWPITILSVSRIKHLCSSITESPERTMLKKCMELYLIWYLVDTPPPSPASLPQSAAWDSIVCNRKSTKFLYPFQDDLPDISSDFQDAFGMSKKGLKYEKYMLDLSNLPSSHSVRYSTLVVGTGWLCTRKLVCLVVADVAEQNRKCLPLWQARHPQPELVLKQSKSWV